MKLSLQNITKQFDDQPALQGVSLNIAGGEIVCLLGPSGCGKTTLLRIIAGLERPDSGQVRLDGQDLSPVPPHRRDFGLMFQDFALFPHKNVFENVAFGLRMKKDKGIANKGKEASPRHSPFAVQVEAMLRLVGLEGFEKRSVTQLSGGEAQRVALARSLAPNPRLLMLDEPLGALDRALRERLMWELRDILKTVGVTAVYVTHDQAEAFAIADQVAVMNRGRIEQLGPPETIYRTPATPFVARFLGLSNLAEGKILAPNRVVSPWGELTVSTTGYAPGQSVTVLIRPEAAQLSTNGSSPSTETNQPPGTEGEQTTNHLRGRLRQRSFRGGRYQVQIQPDNSPPLTFEIMTAADFPAAPGDMITLSLEAAGIVLLPG